MISPIPASSSDDVRLYYGFKLSDLNFKPVIDVLLDPVSEDAPLPPGVAAWPAPGEAVASPQLAKELVGEHEGVFGPAVGEIGTVCVAMSSGMRSDEGQRRSTSLVSIGMRRRDLVILDLAETQPSMLRGVGHRTGLCRAAPGSRCAPALARYRASNGSNPTIDRIASRCDRYRRPAVGGDHVEREGLLAIPVHQSREARETREKRRPHRCANHHRCDRFRGRYRWADPHGGESPSAALLLFRRHLGRAFAAGSCGKARGSSGSETC